MPHLKKGIRAKFTLIMCGISFFIMTAVLSAVYLRSTFFIQDMVGRYYSMMAQHLALSMHEMLAIHVRDLRTHGMVARWAGVLTQNRFRYSAIDASHVSRHIQELNEQWVLSSSRSGLVKSLLNTEASKELQQFISINTDIKKVILTDTFGALVAASGRTAEYYQADKPWWQKAYDNGKGKVYISNVDYDSSIQSWGINVAFPIQNEFDEVLGICNAFLDNETVFNGLDRFRVGATGKAFLIDDAMRVLSSTPLKQHASILTSSSSFKDLLQGKRTWTITKESYAFPYKQFLVAAPFNDELLLQNGIKWFVVITQDMDEVFDTLNVLYKKIVVLGLGMLVVIIPLGYWFGAIFANPIVRFYDVVSKVSFGKWDQKIQMRTGDEFERLADTFNKMMEELKTSHAKIQQYTVHLEEEVKSRTKELETMNTHLDELVKERTGELTRSHAAMAAMIQDLNRQAVELRETQDKLVRSEKLAALGRLAGIVSHELRNPLGVMKNAVYYLKMKLAERLEDTTRKHLDIIDEEITISEKIITDILTFSRVRDPQWEDISVHMLLHKSLERVKVPEYIEVVFAISDPAITFKGDYTQLMQVLVNLISNAVQAMPEKGTLTLRETHTEQGITLEVSDTGKGISAENLPKVFEPFFTTKAKGLGLGLALSQTIVENHKGTLGVASEIGKGTLFTIYLPFISKEV